MEMMSLVVVGLSNALCSHPSIFDTSLHAIECAEPLNCLDEHFHDVHAGNREAHVLKPASARSHDSQGDLG